MPKHISTQRPKKHVSQQQQERKECLAMKKWQFGVPGGSVS